MASCNDCLHVKICQKTRIMDPTHNYAIECNDFKDRSRFVELPFEQNKNALCALNLEECEVIGNIHDNPELMEVAQ